MVHFSRIFGRSNAESSTTQTSGTSPSARGQPRTLGCSYGPLEGLNTLRQFFRPPNPVPNEAIAQAAGVSMALTHPDLAVVVNMRHPRPSSAETTDIRSTADAQVSLRARQEADRWVMDVETNRFGHPATQRVGPHRSRKKLSRETGKVVASIAAGLEGAGCAPATDGPRLAHLPGPSQQSSLAPEQRRLIGVARFPDPLYNKENEPANQAYGERFHATVIEAGRRIAGGQIKTLRHVWDFAGTARHEWAKSGSAQYYQLGPAQEFASGYPRSRRTSVTPMALEGQRYGYIAERLEAADRAGSQLLQLGPNSTISVPDKGPFFMGRKALQMKERLDGREIKLTALKIPVTPSDFTGTEARMLQDGPTPKIRAAAWPSLIEHVNVNDVQPIINHVELLFADILRRPRACTKALMRDLGEIHWWLAHAMPDSRGSAAKTELSIRALAAAHGLELPPFKHGIVPDLEAFVIKRKAFCEAYAALFEGPIPELLTSSGAATGPAPALPSKHQGSAASLPPKAPFRPTLDPIPEDVQG